MCCGSRHILTRAVGCLLGVLLLRPAAAQQEAVTGQQAVASAEVNRAQVENYIRVMKGELERADARVSAVTAQLVALDDDIESRVSRMVSLLSSVRDSTDTSGSRMRKAKEEALAGLKATAVYYAQQRDRRKQEMGNRFAQLDEDALARDVAALNARIETRVTQSLAIATSLAQHQEGATQRYEDEDTDYTRETREYRKARSDARSSVKVKTDVVDDLRASVDKLTRDIKAREAELRLATDPRQQERLSKDIQGMRTTIAARRAQVEKLITAPKPSTRPVSSAAAFEMDKLMDEMTRELKMDFAKFKHLVNERDAARARLKPLRDRLAKAEAMLAAKQAERREP